MGDRSGYGYGGYYPGNPVGSAIQAFTDVDNIFATRRAREVAEEDRLDAKKRQAVQDERATTQWEQQQKAYGDQQQLAKYTGASARLQAIMASAKDENEAMQLAMSDPEVSPLIQELAPKATNAELMSAIEMARKGQDAIELGDADELVGTLNALYQRKSTSKNGKPANSKISGFRPIPNSDRFAIELDVEEEGGGEKYKAPMTKGANADPNAAVTTTNPQQGYGAFKTIEMWSNMLLAKRAELNDKEAGVLLQKAAQDRRINDATAIIRDEMWKVYDPKASPEENAKRMSAVGKETSQAYGFENVFPAASIDAVVNNVLGLRAAGVAEESAKANTAKAKAEAEKAGRAEVAKGAAWVDKDGRVIYKNNDTSGTGSDGEGGMKSADRQDLFRLAASKFYNKAIEKYAEGSRERGQIEAIFNDKDATPAQQWASIVGILEGTQDGADAKSLMRMAENNFRTGKMGVGDAVLMAEQQLEEGKRQMAAGPDLRGAIPSHGPTAQPKGQTILDPKNPEHREIAKQLIHEAGGDRNKARQLAKERGMVF